VHGCTLLLQQYCLLVAEDDDKHMSGRYCLMKTAKATKLKAPELITGNEKMSGNFYSGE